MRLTITSLKQSLFRNRSGIFHHQFPLFAVEMIYYLVGPHSGSTNLAPTFSKDSFRLSSWCFVSLLYGHLHLKKQKGGKG